MASTTTTTTTNTTTNTTTSIPSSNPSMIQSRRVLYVGGLSNDVTLAMVRAAMIPFGPLKSVDMPMDYTSGVHKGFGFVEFEDADDAAEAIYNMDGSELMGRTLTVNLAQSNQQQQKLGDHKAIWSTDDWFQKQAGIEGKEEQDKKESTKQDESVLKEQ